MSTRAVAPWGSCQIRPRMGKAKSGLSAVGAGRGRGHTSKVATESSSWRPPWFDTHMDLKPVSIARVASTPRATPLRATGPVSPHSEQSHSASFQSNSGFICARGGYTCDMCMYMHMTCHVHVHVMRPVPPDIPRIPPERSHREQGVHREGSGKVQGGSRGGCMPVRR